MYVIVLIVIPNTKNKLIEFQVTDFVLKICFVHLNPSFGPVAIIYAKKK